jgi:pyridoxine 4-dehydrogenase
MAFTTIFGNLGLDALHFVNLRVGAVMGPSEGSIEEPLTVLAALKSQGLIRHLGLSNVLLGQLAEARKITEIVCVQNFYNVANRNDDGFIDELNGQGIAYVPFFPLGGFSPLQSSALDGAAASLEVRPMQVALAWLMQHSPNILLIPGTSSVRHLRENLKAATLQFPREIIADLDAIGEALSRSMDGVDDRNWRFRRGLLSALRIAAITRGLRRPCIIATTHNGFLSCA